MAGEEEEGEEGGSEEEEKERERREGKRGEEGGREERASGSHLVHVSCVRISNQDQNGSKWIKMDQRIKLNCKLKRINDIKRVTLFVHCICCHGLYNVISGCQHLII